MADEQQRIILRGRQEFLKPLITEILALNQVLKGKDIGNNYSIPVTTFQDQFHFPPQIKLVFRQSRKEVINNKATIRYEICFRIMNETNSSITPAKALALAQKIKLEMVTGTLFKINKGKLIITYLDKAKGYDFRLRVVDENEGRRIINKVLDIQDHTPEWERLVVHESKAPFPELPSKELIYGENRRPPRRRPVGLVPFKWAEMHVWGLNAPVSLVDTTGSRDTPLA